MSEWSVVPDAAESEWSVVPDVKERPLKPGDPSWLDPVTFRKEKAAGRYKNQTGSFNELMGGLQAGKQRAEENFQKAFTPQAGESRLARGAKTFSHGVGSLATMGGEIIGSRGTVLADDAKRRQMLRGLDDMVTLGYGQKLADRVGTALGDTPDVSLSGTVGADEANPAAAQYRSGARMAGAFMPGAANYIARNVATPFAALASRVPVGGVLPSAAVGAGAAVAGGAVGSAGTAALSADSEGHRLDAALEAGTDPFGATMSALAGGTGGAGRGKAQQYRDPRTMEGRTVAAVERGGGKIKPFGDPVKPVAPGAIADVEAMGLPKGREGMNELAGQSRDAIKGHNRELLKTARAKYGSDVDTVLAEHAERSHLAENAHSVLDQLDAENTLSTGKPVSRVTANKLAELRSKLTTTTEQLDQQASLRAGEPVYVSAPAVRVDDMIKVKKFVSEQAEWGSPSTAKNRKYRLLSDALNKDAAAVDPRIAEINSSYAKTMSQLEEANDILFGSRKKDVPDSAAADKRANLKLGRIGDDTQAATTDRLGRLGKLDPAYAEQLRLLEAKKAMERLRYGEPEVSTSIEKGMGRAAQRAVPGVVGGAVGGLPGWVAGQAASSALANPIALKLRLGLPAAEMVGRKFTGSSGALMDRLIELQRQRDEEQKRMAGMLTQ